MAGLFFLLTLVIFAIFTRQYRWAIGLMGVTLILCGALFYHHVTNILHINL